METVNLVRAENLEGRVDVGAALGSSATLMFVYDVAPGQRQSAYHYEYDEEWLLVVDGTLVLRAPDGEHTLERGDLVRFPPGPDATVTSSSARARRIAVCRASRSAWCVSDSDSARAWASPHRRAASSASRTAATGPPS